MGWTDVHVGLEGDGLRIGGLAVWQEKWKPVGEDLDLPHPAHPLQTHRYRVYEIGDAPCIRFAAGELSNGVWGFYVPS